MLRMVLCVGLWLTLPVFVGTAEPGVQAEPECVIVVTTEGSHDFLVCDEHIAHSAIKGDPTTFVEFGLTTDRGAVACQWPPNSTIDCDGPIPTGTPGTVATFWLAYGAGAGVITGSSVFVVESASGTIV